MAGTPFIKTKVTAGKLSALHRAMIWIIGRWEVENGHDDLLLIHATELRNYFDKMMQNKQKKYGLKFSASQALAFCQLWGDNYKHLQPYEMSVVHETTGLIDRERKQLLIVSHETYN